MTELGEAQESEMILAFLRAEIDSPSWACRYHTLLANAQLDRSTLIDNADLTNESHNQERRTLLQSVRGYSHKFLFSGFPRDVRWRRVEVETHEHARLKYAREVNWLRLSDYSRSVIRCVEKMQRDELPKDPADSIREVQRLLRSGKSFPELIAVEGQGADLILVEGHVRATAYVAARQKVVMFLGSSPSMHSWAFY